MGIKMKLDLTQKVPEGPKCRKRSQKFKFWACLHTNDMKILTSHQDIPVLRHLLDCRTMEYVEPIYGH